MMDDCIGLGLSEVGVGRHEHGELIHIQFNSLTSDIGSLRYTYSMR